MTGPALDAERESTGRRELPLDPPSYERELRRRAVHARGKPAERPSMPTGLPAGQSRLRGMTDLLTALSMRAWSCKPDSEPLRSAGWLPPPQATRPTDAIPRFSFCARRQSLRATVRLRASTRTSGRRSRTGLRTRGFAAVLLACFASTGTRYRATEHEGPARLLRGVLGARIRRRVRAGGSLPSRPLVC
jgi:hypothetical protein